MKRRNLFVDVATVLSSLVLVTGFICYRAGVFNRLMASSPQPTASTSVPTPDDNPAGTDNPVKDLLVTVDESQKGSLIFMVGSKSAAALPAWPSAPGEVHRAPSQEQSPATAQPNVTVIMPGSKSVFIPTAPTFPVGNQPSTAAPPPPPPAFPQPAAPATPAPPVFLPGSKSLGGIELLRPPPPPFPAPVPQSAPSQKP